MDLTFTISISHRQLVIFDPTLDAPFNDWNADHLQQGFAWRPGSVSFSTLLDSGRLDVRVVVQPHPTPNEQAECRIEVPFTVPTHGIVAIGGVMDPEQEVELRPGPYQLRYEAHEASVWLTFTPTRDPVFWIQRQDVSGKSLVVLTTEAESAD